jgi:hypothetical protein
LNKNYFVLGLILLIAAVYFIFFAEKVYSFDSGLAEINSFWEKQELKPADLTSSMKVYAVEETKLIELKEDLTSFQDFLSKQPDSDEKEKLLLLIETELNLIENALIQKKNYALIDFFESVEYDFGVVCSSLDKAEELQKNLLLQANSAESFNAKVKDFSSSFPEEAKKAEISGLQLKAGQEKKLSEMELILSDLKVVC